MRDKYTNLTGPSEKIGCRNSTSSGSFAAAATTSLTQVSVSPSKVESPSTTCTVDSSLRELIDKRKGSLTNSSDNSKPLVPYNSSDNSKPLVPYNSSDNSKPLGPFNIK